MTEAANIGTGPFLALGLGAALAFLIPLGIALIWKYRKKEKITTILVGAATFLLFALILEKPLQALVISVDHPVSRFLNANPVWLALVGALFAGIFEETGRLVAFKTLLRKRKNRETSISHGIGHGGAEVVLTLGLTYLAYLAYAAMIHSGAFGTLLDLAAAQAPEQAEALSALPEQLAGITLADVSLGFVERVFAVLFHIGASILVFYACRENGRFWLYPLAMALHTALDFIAALAIVKVIRLSTLALEAIIGVFGILTFCGAYFLLYRRDKKTAQRRTNHDFIINGAAADLRKGQAPSLHHVDES